MSISENIEFLSNLHGVSGDEQNVAKGVKKLFEPYCDELITDTLGNMIGIKKSKKSEGKVLLEAHMDEVGLIINDMDDEGFLYFETVGGIDLKTLPAQEVLIFGKTTIRGVIGSKPPHIATEEEKDKVVPQEKLYIDTGYTGEELKKIVRIGDTVAIGNITIQFPGTQISTKALDDRAGVVAIVEMLEQLKDTELPFDLYVAACTQEELGHRGAMCAAYDINPDFAIALDVTNAKTPDSSIPRFDMGKGPAIAMGPNIHPVLFNAVKKVFDEKEIPYHINAVPSKTGTDAAAFQIAGNGIPTLLFSIPIKYMHTCIETVDTEDVKTTGTGLAEFLKSVEKVGDVICY